MELLFAFLALFGIFAITYTLWVIAWYVSQVQLEIKLASIKLQAKFDKIQIELQRIATQLERKA